MEEVAAVRVAEGRDALGGKSSSEKAAAETTDAETSRLFGGEDDNLNAAAIFNVGLFQNAQGFESAQQADHAIVATGIWNGVNVRTGGNGREFRGKSGPPGEDVANRILADGEVKFRANTFDEGARLDICFGKQNASDDRRRSFGNGRQSVYLTA